MERKHWPRWQTRRAGGRAGGSQWGAQGPCSCLLLIYLLCELFLMSCRARRAQEWGRGHCDLACSLQACSLLAKVSGTADNSYNVARIDANVQSKSSESTSPLRGQLVRVLESRRHRATPSKFCIVFEEFRHKGDRIGMAAVRLASNSALPIALARNQSGQESIRISGAPEGGVGCCVLEKGHQCLPTTCASLACSH